MHQRTLSFSVSCKGVGLHHGNYAHMTLHPAPQNTGIVFRRVDLNPVQEIKVSALNVVDTRLCTVVGYEGIRVSTVEHLMSALAGLGIDNVYIDIDADEVPIMDGSSSEFVFLIQSAGVKVQTSDKSFIKILKPIRVEADFGGWAEFTPYEGYKLTFSIDFAHKAFEDTAAHMDLEFSTTAYLKEVSRNRTFGFIKDLEKLRANNLALGANFGNAIGIGEDGQIYNHEGLRNKDEFVRHKVLDAVGDLYMLGHPIIGHFSAYKSGHMLNNKLLRALVDQPDAWELVTYAKGQAPVKYGDDLFHAE